jgi:hypothetical protein
MRYIKETDLIVKYSDGREESLLKLLKEPMPGGNMYSDKELDNLEFKILAYFYKNGYELIYVDRLNVRPCRYFFKHK